MTMTIRTPGEHDRLAWETLYTGYATFYGMPISEATLDIVWGWIQEGSRLQGRIVVNEEGKAVGLMHFRAMPSPLRGAEVGFLDDLFVAPEHRGNGAVFALISALKVEALQYGWPFVRWITRDNNYRARAVYDRIADQTDWVTYQLCVAD